MTREIDGLSEIVAAFDAVIVDQYGVLHDGQTAFQGAQDALQQLHARGIPIAALTNSGKRSETNARRLERLGFPTTLFKTVVSSGEIARDRLAQLASGAHVLLIARQGETELIDGLDVVQVMPGTGADIIVISAVEPNRKSLSAYAQELLPYARAQVPALLVNPDQLSIENGTAVFGPGAVGDDYASSGGLVEVLGKPARKMFDVALEALGNPSPDRVLMIGDSPHHDIEGAANAGLQTLLVRGGVQSDLIGHEPGHAITELRW